MIEKAKRDFYWSKEREPHLNRRKEILNKHPEVRNLIGPDIKLAYTTIFLVVFQLASAFFIHKLIELPYGFLYFILAAYFIGATVTHSLFLAIHEITHNLAFRGPKYTTII